MVEYNINLALHKRGIAMIELIFSIVIMGIVLLSAPMLIQQSISSGNVALQQEAIVAAASQTSIILSMHWDENNNSNSAVSPMLNVGKSNTEAFYFEHNQTSGTHIEPVGLPTGISGRSTQNTVGDSPQATPLNRLGPDEANETILTQFDDVDDYDGSELNLTVFHGETTTSDIGDYVDTTIVMNTTVNYAEDRPNGGFLNSKDITITPIVNSGRINSTSIGRLSNIKFIQVRLTSKSGIDELSKNITFEAFSCNIGTTQPEGDNH
jgi:hypothetical protein